MPLYWTIDSRERLVMAVAEGGVRRDEMESYLDAVAGAGAGTYRKLFDGNRGEPLMEADDIMALAVKMRGMQQLGLAGPLAIVMPREKYDQFARMLGILAVPDRPIRFFTDPAAARAWLEEPEVREWKTADGGDEARMPLHWVIDSRERLMTAVAEGEVRKEDASAYLDAMAGTGANTFRRLFDGNDGEPLLSDDEIMELAVRMRGLQETSVSGPLAIVMPRDKYQKFARMLGILAIPDRPMRFFTDADAARAWLEEPEVRNWQA